MMQQKQEGSPPQTADENTYLQSSLMVDSGHSAVIGFALHAVEGITGEREKAVALYYAVRDEIRYDPYHVDVSVEGLKASACLEKGFGFCVTKAALLAAAGRAVGIPSRLGFADVRNHLSSERLRQMMGTNLFVYHGYTEFLLDGRWVKATPAFNLALCEKAGIQPLEFDGHTDSIFHPLDNAGRQHMEYVRERGSFADIPRDELIDEWRKVYRDIDKLFQNVPTDVSFEDEARA